jgi:hypothetical protein
MTMTPRIPEGSSVRSFSRLVLLVGVMLFTSMGLAGVAPAYADLAPTATSAAQALPATTASGSYLCTWWTGADRTRGCPRIPCVSSW